MGFNIILNNFIPNARRLFLIDGQGALLSAFFLGVVLVYFEENIGMPGPTLYFLAVIASGFAVYSLSCYLIQPVNYRPYVLAIATLNLLYCSLTLGLVIYHRNSLSLLGFSYFILEIIVIVILVYSEITFIRSKEANEEPGHLQ